MIKALLLDLDDTLYEYGPCEAAGRAALYAHGAKLLGMDPGAFEAAYLAARKAVKARSDSPSSHSRILYISDLLHTLAKDGAKEGPPALELCKALESSFWGAYLGAAKPRPDALTLLEGFRSRGGKVAIVTDLTLDIQLQKLEALGLFSHVDALVASEEVGVDKPHRAAFDLAVARLGVTLEDCAVIGDNLATDGEGARRLELPFYHARTDAIGVGLTLAAILDDLIWRNKWEP